MIVPQNGHYFWLPYLQRWRALHFFVCWNNPSSTSSILKLCSKFILFVRKLTLLDGNNYWINRRTFARFFLWSCLVGYWSQTVYIPWSSEIRSITRQFLAVRMSLFWVMHIRLLHGLSPFIESPANRSRSSTTFEVMSEILWNDWVNCQSSDEVGFLNARYRWYWSRMHLFWRKH